MSGPISRLESISCHFSAKVTGMEDKDYWERLAELHMYSQERRRERYSIIFLWKLAQQLVSGYTVEFVQNPRRGRLAVVHPTVACAPASVRRAREGSLQVKGNEWLVLVKNEKNSNNIFFLMGGCH